ncbi:hypothetical protein MTsPCn9_08660 [Croceitalea sp. MTPC9]|nr:hypothetical protein MTsPCn6_00050 [Croceitalea sp. MTPC6]GMN15930.1 hypothetical protein MTsPCn9_08660 [Croceitalea sp. MTPC9]
MLKPIKFKNRLKNLQNNIFNYFLIVPIFFLNLSITAQNNPLAGFEPLMGKTWKTEKKWDVGTIFKQEITFEYALGGSIVRVYTKGFTNEAETAFGNRNHGIRQFDSESNTIKFWEFDVFGGVTEGTVHVEEKNIRYDYFYNGSFISDLWEYVDDNTYNFKVGTYKDGKFQQIYLETVFKAEEKSGFDFHFDHQSIVVTKLRETGDFYRDILQLKEIPHPDKAQGFRWFQVRGNSQLHLIKKDVIEFKKDKSIHLCLSTQDLEGFITHLVTNYTDFYNWPGEKGSVTDRSDGVKQIYLQDPDGYWVEVNTAKH